VLRPRIKRVVGVGYVQSELASQLEPGDADIPIRFLSSRFLSIFTDVTCITSLWLPLTCTVLASSCLAQTVLINTEACLQIPICCDGDLTEALQLDLVKVLSLHGIAVLRVYSHIRLREDRGTYPSIFCQSVGALNNKCPSRADRIRGVG